LGLSAEWRAACSVDAEITYLNIGTLGPTLSPAWQAVSRSYVQWMSGGPGGSIPQAGGGGYFDAMRIHDELRHDLGAWLDVDPSAVAIANNATDAINLAVCSIPFEQGDHIVTTREEHPALTEPIRRLARRFHLRVTEIEYAGAQADAAFVERLQGALTSKTRLVALSETSHRTAWSISLAEVCQALMTHPAVLLIDGSQAVGSRVVRLHERVDFYVFPGHKWLMAPVGTGVLVSQEREEAVTMPLLGGAASIFNGRRDEQAVGAQYEFGTRNWALGAGFIEALRFRSQWPEGEIVAHYGKLSDAFRGGYRGTGAVSTVTGEGPLLNVETAHPDAVAEKLWTEHRILTKPHEFGLRISLAPWMESEECEAAGDVIARYVTRAG
jgi:cysteine desulfurase/selenocysteine lyase